MCPVAGCVAVKGWIGRSSASIPAFLPQQYELAACTELPSVRAVHAVFHRLSVAPAFCGITGDGQVSISASEQTAFEHGSLVFRRRESFMTNQILAPVSFVALVALVVSGVIAFRAHRESARLQRIRGELEGEVEQLRQGCADRDSAVEAFARGGVASVVASVRAGEALAAGVGGSRALAGTGFVQSLRSVAEQVAAGVQHAGADAAQFARLEAVAEAREATEAAVKSLAGVVLASGAALSKVIDEGLLTHKSDASFETLTGIDHMAQQMNRVAASFAVLCGAKPGRRWPSTSLTDVVRGAVGRIRDYPRVKYQASDRAVQARAVEPVVHALAMLLDNATRYSNPQMVVDVSFQQGYSGVTVVICDAGVRMNEEQLAAARTALSGATVDLHGLGPHPKVGFWTVGALASRYGFQAYLDTSSPFGGMRAMLFLPDTLLTTIDAPPQVPVQRLAVTPQQTPDSGEYSQSVPGAGPAGLPQRRRKPGHALSSEGCDTSAPAVSDRPGRASVVTAWSKGARRAPAQSSSDAGSTESE